MPSIQLAVSGPTASQKYVAYKPREYKPDGTKRWIVYLHSASLSSYSHLTSAGAGAGKLLQAVGDVFPIIAIDGGTIPGSGTDDGTETFGNTTAVNRIADAVAWVIDPAKGGGKTDKVMLMGTSQGAAGIVNYAKANPTKVAAMVGVLPVSDLQNSRVNDWGPGLRAVIDGAHGVTYPASLPAGVDPATNYSGASGIPLKAFYLPSDATVPHSTVTDLWVTKLGGTEQAISPDGAHSDAAVGNVPVSDVISFLLPYAA